MDLLVCQYLSSSIRKRKKIIQKNEIPLYISNPLSRSQHAVCQTAWCVSLLWVLHCWKRTWVRGSKLFLDLVFYSTCCSRRERNHSGFPLFSCICGTPWSSCLLKALSRPGKRFHTVSHPILSNNNTTEGEYLRFSNALKCRSKYKQEIHFL